MVYSGKLQYQYRTHVSFSSNSINLYRRKFSMHFFTVAHALKDFMYYRFFSYFNDEKN